MDIGGFLSMERKIYIKTVSLLFILIFSSGCLARKVKLKYGNTSILLGTFALGGAVNNLFGTLVLKNSNGDTVTVKSSGQFVFSLKLADAVSYSVSVSSQPSMQNCILENPEGVINSADVTNIKVTCTGNSYGPLVSGTIVAPLSFTNGVTTLAGSYAAPNSAGTSNSGFTNSADASAVQFSGPEGIATDGTNLFIGDKNNNVIRKTVIATGETTTLAGSGVRGILDGTGTSAKLDTPVDLTCDGVYVYFSDPSNRAVRKAEISTGKVTTIISNNSKLVTPKGLIVYNNKLYISEDTNNAIMELDLYTLSVKTVLTSGISNPQSMTLVGSTMYISDRNTHTIRKTVIGTWTGSIFAGISGNSGHIDGTATSARFNSPEGITNDGNYLYVTESNNCIRQIDISTGTVTTLAGPSTGNSSGYTNSSVHLNALFSSPRAITSDGSALYLADRTNSAIRKIN